MREQSMQAGLSVRFDRSPDYFALHAAHSSNHVTWILTSRGRVVGSMSAVIRPAYVARSVRTVAYLADLRQARARGLAGVWRRLAATVLDEIRHEFGATHAFCSILRGNRLARASILESQSGRTLRFSHLHGYSTVSVVARLPLPRWRRHRIAVRRATADDNEALREFIDARCRGLQFAPVFDRPTWRGRIEDWPDFGIGSFWLATDTRGRIIGCLAPWDSSTINRIVIDALPFRAELLRRTLNAAAFMTRRPRIHVGPASHLPDVSLTHLFIENRDPDVFANLLSAAFDERMRTRRYATMSCCLYDDDPLWRGLRAMVRNAVPMDLYFMPLDPSAGPNPDNTLWPGFEGYLV